MNKITKATKPRPRQCPRFSFLSLVHLYPLVHFFSFTCGTEFLLFFFLYLFPSFFFVFCFTRFSLFIFFSWRTRFVFSFSFPSVIILIHPCLFFLFYGTLLFIISIFISVLFSSIYLSFFVFFFSSAALPSGEVERELLAGFTIARFIPSR